MKGCEERKNERKGAKEKEEEEGWTNVRLMMMMMMKTELSIREMSRFLVDINRLKSSNHSPV